jgi:hypothetical protein
MPKNKTLYVNDEDAPIWNDAKRLLAFYRGMTLSSYITECLRKYVTEENAIQERKAESERTPKTHNRQAIRKMKV